MKYFYVLAAILILLTSALPAADKKAAPVKAKTVVVQKGELPEPTPPAQAAATAERAGEEINWQVISGGGSMGGVSENYQLSGTVGQTATGEGASDNYGVTHGFWQDLGGGSCCNLAGDANDDGSVNVGDAVFMINYVFKSGLPPNCGDEGDANFDCALNVGDAVYLINYVFKSGPTPQCGCMGW